MVDNHAGVLPPDNSVGGADDLYIQSGQLGQSFEYKAGKCGDNISVITQRLIFQENMFFLGELVVKNGVVLYFAVGAKGIAGK